MKRKRILLFILCLVAVGGWTAAQADLSFKPFAQSYTAKQSPKWEQDAEVLAQVWWGAPNPSGYNGVTAIDGSFLYDKNIFEYALASKPKYLNETDLSSLNSLVDSQYTTTAGSALFSRTIASNGSPISFQQKNYKVYVPVLQVKNNATVGNTTLSFNSSFAKALGKGSNGDTQDITGTLIPLTIPISAAAPPQNFAGPNSTVNVNGTTGKAIGNTVKISWTDLNDANNPFLNDDTPPITYDLYYNEGADFSPNDATNRISSGLSNNSKTYGNNGNPDPSVLLKDKTTYYFKVRAKDSTTTPDVLDKHKTTYKDTIFASVQINDYTAPENFSISLLDPANQKITVNWLPPSNNKNDLAGYIVLRKEVSASDPDPTLPTLVSATNNVDGDDYSEVPTGSEIIGGSGWIKVAQVSNITTKKVDDGLDNNKKYKYAVYAYDDVDEYRQGRNYSIVPATKIGQPGEAPDVLQNFIALSSPEAKQISLNWDLPTQSFYKGAKLVYTTNKADWAGLDANSPLAADVPATATLPFVLKQINGQDLDLSSIYYFKAFSYNDAGMTKTSGAAAAAIPTIAGSVNPFTETTQNITLKGAVKDTSFGITTFSISINADLQDIKGLDAGGAQKTSLAKGYTIHDLVKAINLVAGSNRVSAIGYYDAKFVGLTKIGYPDNAAAGSAIDANKSTAKGDTIDNILKTAVMVDKAYQVSLSGTEDVVIGLKGFKQK